MNNDSIKSNITNNYDVIIIGSGFAGLTAAIECKINGGNVIVLEKMKAIGGNSVISDGGIAAPDTSIQKSCGITDTPQLMFEDMMRSAEGLNNSQLAQLVCDQALEAYTWTKDFLHVKYLPRVDIFGGHSVPRCYSPDPLSGYTIIQKMKQKCDDLQIEIKLQAYVESFIRNQDNHIIGVNYDSNYSLDSNHIKELSVLYAHKGVIVASGGFAADTAFIQKINHSFPINCLSTNKKTTSANVLELCMRINAATIHLDQIQWMPWTSQNEIGYGIGGLFGDYIVSSNGVLIDIKNGSRFVNECGNRKVITQEILKVKDVIGLVDSKSVENSGWNLEQALNKGIIKLFASFDELINYYSIPRESFLNTIHDYNLGITLHQTDVFGKVVESWMTPIIHAPFYTMPITPKTHYSLGGLVIDCDGHVLDTQGHILKGLYAAGEVTGLTHGANRLGSCSITECIVMGRVVGRNILN